MLNAFIYLSVAVLICFGICFFVFQRKERDWERISVLSLSLSLILVLVLRCYAEFRCDSWDWLFIGIQTVFDVLEGDSCGFRTALSALPVIPELLSCAVPALAVFTAARLLWHYLPHHVPWFKKEWYLFSELDANSVRMAKNLAREDRLCIFLRTPRNKADTALLKELGDIHFFLYPGDEARLLLWPWRRGHILRFFFLSENTDENFQRMQDFLLTAGKKRLFKPRSIALPDGQSQQELYLLSETESAPMLIDHLRGLLKNSDCLQHTELRLLDRFRATSYDLLQNVPLHEHIHDGKLHVLILGFGKIGREFFRAASHMGVIHGCKTEFTLCDLSIKQKLNAFLCQCPELRCSVTFRSMELDAETNQLDQLIRGRQFNYILVALGDDERNIRVTSRLKGHYRRLHWACEAQNKKRPQTASEVQPQICVNIEDSIKHSYTGCLWKAKFTGDKSLHIFGGLDQVFTQEVLMPQNLWKAAHWLHMELNRNSDGTLSTSGWGEYERRSSIACAAHAAYHTASVGPNYLEILSQWKNAQQEDGRSGYDNLIDTEHRRWMAYVRSEGLRKAGLSLVDVYYDPKHGRHVDILGKLTPCLEDSADKLQAIWDQLSQDHESYTGKYSFRQRDELLILNSQIITDGIETGDFPDRAITEITA